MTERFDPHVFDAPNMRDAYQRCWDEATDSSVEGYVDDWILSTLPWDFQLRDIAVPVFSWFGENDVLVPRNEAERVSAEIPQSVSIGCPDCRHYVPIAHWPEILEQTAL